MEKILKIRKCDDCPYFWKGKVGDGFEREVCRKNNRKPISYDSVNNIFPIPEWCPLEDSK